jgi:hypothetical protein
MCWILITPVSLICEIGNFFLTKPLNQGFPTFLCLRPPKHQLRPPADTNVPNISQIWDLSRPPGWEPLH